MPSNKPIWIFVHTRACRELRSKGLQVEVRNASATWSEVDVSHREAIKPTLDAVREGILTWIHAANSMAPQSQVLFMLKGIKNTFYNLLDNTSAMKMF
jgi:hypothetical protein